ncbi:uncharacterized protein LOC114411369 [Glycine soja]|uniref:uncharacterized protein LOC114411369 n=1 Tax=Glycine soja TaxID=3848 RepID=UPI00103A342B|nr:uncharacterized protein LOC114411369 [Glycine soja]
MHMAMLWVFKWYLGVKVIEPGVDKFGISFNKARKYNLSFGFDMWHLELITGLVVLISSCRYLLLKTWPDFAESSEAANQQVLSSLQPLDYIVVAFLPGISEELLFRGAILPLLGMNWNSIAIAALIFGVLHLGNGPNYSFAICMNKTESHYLSSGNGM